MTDNVTRTPVKGGGVPLISVVLPVYNGQKYLAEAIDSILAQTFANFELIMIDDGSTDGSLQIMRNYEQNDARVRVVARENRGLATTLNDSIDIARGEWLARMDQDDIALPYRFERQLAWLKETGADISGSWVQRFGSSDKRVVRLRESNEAIRMEMLFCSPFAHPTVMMRAALAKRLRYDSAWEKAEDYDLWERAAEDGWKMTNQPEVLLLYRVHESQISSTTSVRQQQLGQKIRYRYWKYVFEMMQLDQNCIHPVIEISEPSPSNINMDIVDSTLSELLRHSHGEARDAILDHVTRLYYRVAADCKDVISRWIKLNQMFSGKLTTKIIVKLWLLHTLKIRPESRIFRVLKRLHISLSN